MLFRIIIATFCLSLLIFSACSSEPSANSNGSGGNADAKNLPDGMKTEPLKPDGKSTPGIPDPKNANLNDLPKGTSPTPGIPDPKSIGKTPIPKGATPTPGIPSKEELEQMKKRKVSIDEVNNPSASSKSDSKSDKKEVSPIDRQRKVDDKKQ